MTRSWQRRVTRRWLIGTVPTVVVGVGLAGPMAKQGVRAGTESDPEAAARLEAAAVAMAAVQSFHFDLTTVQGKTEVLEGLEVKGIAGDVLRPDRFRATITASFLVATVSVKVIGVGSRLWVTDPRAQAETYIAVDAGENLDQLLNPDRLLLEAVAVIQEAEITGGAEIDGVTTTKIEGIVDFRAAVEQAARGTPVPDEVPDRQLLIAVWIDDANLVRRIAIGGPLTDAEAPDVIRQLDLTNFDEPVTIDPPSATPVAG